MIKKFDSRLAVTQLCESVVWLQTKLDSIGNRTLCHQFCLLCSTVFMYEWTTWKTFFVTKLMCSALVCRNAYYFRLYQHSSPLLQVTIGKSCIELIGAGYTIVCTRHALHRSNSFNLKSITFCYSSGPNRWIRGIWYSSFSR